LLANRKTFLHGSLWKKEKKKYPFHFLTFSTPKDFL
jgi:hypothetical protein